MQQTRNKIVKNLAQRIHGNWTWGRTIWQDTGISDQKEWWQLDLRKKRFSQDAERKNKPVKNLARRNHGNIMSSNLETNRRSRSISNLNFLVLQAWSCGCCRHIFQFLLAIYVAELGWLCLGQPFSCSNSTRKPRQFRSDSNECDSFPALQR